MPVPHSPLDRAPPQSSTASPAPATPGPGKTPIVPAVAATTPANAATAQHVAVIRTWDTPTIAARRVELQRRLASTVEPREREALLHEYEALEWVARERNLALPVDPVEQAAPQAHIGGRPTKFVVPSSAQGMRAMLEREMAAGEGYADARDHALQRIDHSTTARTPLDRDKQTIGHQQLALLDHDAAAFGAAFRVEAKRTAQQMLDASTVAIDAALRSYGIVGGAHRLTTAAQHVANDPSSLDAEVERWATISAHSDPPPSAAASGKAHRDDLAHQAQQLRTLQDSIAALATEQLRLIQQQHARRPEHPGARPAPQPRGDAGGLEILARQQPLSGSTPFAPVDAPQAGTPDQRLAHVRAALHTRRAQYRAAWIAAERAHPVLATFRGRGTAEDASLDALAPGNDLPRTVIRQALPKLANIYRTKRALQADLDPLQLAPVVALTKQRMFVADDSYRDRVVHDLAQQATEHRSPAHWAFDAVLLGLTLVTLVPSAGASAGIALSLTGLAYDLYAGFEAADAYETTAAAANTDLDALRSLSDTEPSLAPLLTRIISAGLNLTAAAALFRRAAALRRTATQGVLDASAVAELNRDGERLGLRAVGDEAVEGIQGAAAESRITFRPNPDNQRRTLAEALQIAERNGLDIDSERYKFTLTNELQSNVGARYVRLDDVKPGQIIPLSRLQDREGRFWIQVNPNILTSDDKILGVIAHELHEIDLVEQAFLDSGGRLEAKALHALVDAQRGSAHCAAWDYADQIVGTLQKQGKSP